VEGEDGLQPKSPVAVFEEAMRLCVADDLVGFADLFAADGIHELPFAPPGIPRRLEGREAIRNHFSGMANRARVETGFRPVCIHETADPEVIVVELDAQGLVVATGQPYELRYVEVIQVRNGQIVLWRDYWNPLASADVEGQVPQLVARYGDRSTDGK
jgi:ketosteroid isomerase-like protein